jgi:hypothetical protein
MNTKIMLVGSEKTRSLKRHPRIRFAGFWLNDIGFKPDNLVTIEYESKSIMLEVQGSGLDKGVLAGNAGVHNRQSYCC